MGHIADLVVVLRQRISEICQLARTTIDKFNQFDGIINAMAHQKSFKSSRRAVKQFACHRAGDLTK